MKPLSLFLLAVFTLIGTGPVTLGDDKSSSPQPTDAERKPQHLPSAPPPAIRQRLDVKFSDTEGSAGNCDLYLPDVEGPRPVIIVVHGGAWISGDKWTMSGHCKLLAQQGYAVVCVNYRLAPAHKFPAQLDDVRTALLWIKNQANEFNFDLGRLGMFGYSAGGHLSALVAVLANEPMETQTRASEWPADDARWNSLPKIKTVCVGGPPCDFRVLPPGNTSMAYFLGGSRGELPKIYEAASPTANVSPGDPPMQIIHGETDLLVPIDNSIAFQKELESAGIRCDLKIIPHHGHMLTFLHKDLKQTMVEWFANQL